MKKLLLLITAAVSSTLLCCRDTQSRSDSETETGTPTYIRRNAHSPAADADLQAYAKGMDSMRSLPCSDNRSWYYWGAMHHIPDLSEMGGYDTLCPAYGKTMGPPDTWSNCPHMLPGAQQLHFLAWHRLYTWYFERIIRKFSGKKDFAMPYWNYNMATQRTLPTIFRTPTGAANGLWESGRSRLLMAGDSIRSTDVDSIALNVNGIVKNVYPDPMSIILDTSSIWSAKSFSSFSAETEQMPHNCMHDYIGGQVDIMDTGMPIYNRIYQSNNYQGLMAQVPSAGFDPVFFLHHANLDRLWMNWEMDFPDEALSLAEFSQAGMWTYNFIDENGKEVRYSSLQQVFDSIRSINYSYDYLTKRKPALAASARKPGWDTGAVIATHSPARALTATGHQVSLSFTRKLTAPQPAAAAANDVFYKLEVELSVARPTHTFVAVLVDVNDDVPISADVKKHVAGIAGLFGLQRHEGHGGTNGTQDHKGHGGGFSHSSHGGAADGRLHKTFVYDINQELALQNAFNSGNGLTVHLSPLRPDPANPVVLEKVTVREVRRKWQ